MISLTALNWGKGLYTEYVYMFVQNWMDEQKSNSERKRNMERERDKLKA